MTRRALTVALVALAVGCGGRNAPSGQTLEGRALRLPGLASFTAEMLRHGAGERSTEEIAEAIEFVGGDLSVEAETDYVAVEARVLSDHVELAMELLADLVQRPSFPTAEIEKVRRRELDRLSLMSKRPRWLAERELHRAIYGVLHPYGQHDADPHAVAQIERQHLVGFHGEHYVPDNAFVVVAGDVSPERVHALAEEHFGSWAERSAPEQEIPPPPQLPGRRVIVVDRPGSTQTQIAYGNVALRRSDPDYIPLRVANLVLGGNASARLFMNLRERCGYGYGAYSSVRSLLAPAPFAAQAAVEGAATAGALRELFAELDRIVAEPPSAQELDNAKAYLDGTFPMIAETAGNLAALATVQRVHGLAPDYWSTYRSAVMGVTAAQAHAAAREHIRPDSGALVLVGDASTIAYPARRYGEVTIIDVDGASQGTLRASPDGWPGGAPEACPSASGEEPRASRELPSPATARDFAFPETEETRLENGLSVLSIQRTQLPLVHVRVVIRSGSAADPL